MKVTSLRMASAGKRAALKPSSPARWSRSSNIVDLTLVVRRAPVPTGEGGTS